MVAAQQVELKLEELWRLAELIKFFNGQDFSGFAKGSKLSSILPTVIVGSIDSAGRFRAGTIGLTASNVAALDLPSAQQTQLIMDHSRHLTVKDSRWWDWVPEGRTVFEDKFANTISWVQASGTVAYSTVRPYPGNANCMRLTTGAGAGNQAGATLRHFRLADAQGRGLGGSLAGDGPKIWYGVLFKNTDANLGFLELGIQLTDGAQTMIARARLAFPSGLVSVLDSAGGTTALTNAAQTAFWSSGGNPVALGTSEGWHWFAMELHYQSGGTTLRYVRIRIDDTVYDATPYVPAFNSGVAAVSDSLLEITVQNNAAVIENLDIGYVVLKDLTNVRNLLG